MTSDASPEAPRPKSAPEEEAPPHFDAPALLREFRTISDTTTATPAGPARGDITPSSAPDTLTMSNPFSGVDSFAPGADLTERVSRPGRTTTSKPAPSAEPPFTILPSVRPLDPAAPTVAFLDGFIRDRADTLPNGHALPAHGEISARAAEANGYNVLRLQTAEGSEMRISSLLKGIESRIASGELPLGRGDSVNLSLGADQDPTFREMSQLLGFSITAENLAQNREKILQGIKQLANNPSAPRQLREDARDWMESNESIQRLQARGITVIHAAGNQGAAQFSPGFLSASAQLSSVGPDGKPHPFSASHSLTTPANGVVAFSARAFNPFDPTPAARQRGEWTIPGTTIAYPNEGKHPIGLGPERMVFDQDRMRFNLRTNNPLKQVILPVDPVRIPSELVRPESLGEATRFSRGPIMSPDTPQRVASLASPDTSGRPPVPAGPSTPERITRLKVRVDNRNLEISDAPLPGNAPRVSMTTFGTSFSNISYLSREKARFQALKSGSN